MNNSKTSSISFWTFDVEYIEQAFIYNDISKAKFENIICDLKMALKSVDKNNFQRSEYIDYSESTSLPAKIDVDTLRRSVKYVKSQIRNAEITLPFDLDLTIARNSYILDCFQCLKASALFSDVWFLNPRIYFSNRFISDYLPKHNSFIAQHPIYPKTELPTISFEKELFGKQIEMNRDGFKIFQIPVEIAKHISACASKNRFDDVFRFESKMFYKIIDFISKGNTVCLVFHYDNLYIHNSKPI